MAIGAVFHSTLLAESSLPTDTNAAARGLTIRVQKSEQGETICLDSRTSAGETNWLSVSSNLVNWAVLGGGVADAHGILRFEDHRISHITHRYYRILPEPPPRHGLEFGLFINWSNSSFTGRTLEMDGRFADWPSYYANPSQSTEIFFNPPGLESVDIDTLQATVTDPWVDLAKKAGATHLVLCVKHVDGFCLWDSSVSKDFCITSPSRREAPMLHCDLVKAVAQSCAAKEMRLGFYYCLADQHNGWNSHALTAPEITKRHLTELLDGRYGKIDYLFLDIGYGGMDLSPYGTLKYWVTTPQRQDLVDFIHQQGFDPNGSGLPRLGLPKVQIGFNDLDRPFPGDFLCVEQGRPVPSSKIPLEFCIPIMSGFYEQHRWFYSIPEHDNRCMSLDDLRDYYDQALDHRMIFDLSIGPDRSGKLRELDLQTLNAFAQALSDSPSTQPHHFLINDNGSRINGHPNGIITYGPEGSWIARERRGLGDYSDDAHLTTQAGDYCEYQFTGTAVEMIASKSPRAGSVDVYLDGSLQTSTNGLDLFSEQLRPRQVIFAVAGLPSKNHTLKVVNRSDGLELAIDAFRVYSGTPQSLSVEDNGCVWVVDSEHLIWTYHPESDTSPAFWERMPGTARDIGCGRSVWKIGTDVPSPTLNPENYSVCVWKGPVYGWRKMPIGEAVRIDVTSDESIWCVNSRGQAGYFPTPTSYYGYVFAGQTNSASDVGCQSSGGNNVGKTAPDDTLASWTSSRWEYIEGDGTRIDIADNGDIWVVNKAGELGKYHYGHWYWKVSGALDVGCGANGEVWYVSTNGTIQRISDR